MKATVCHKKVADNYNKWQDFRHWALKAMNGLEIEDWFTGLVDNQT